jgi:hypothetical protein
MVTRASNEDRRKVVAAFYEKVVAGLPAEPQWVEGMIDASAVPLPDEPTPEQIAAWMELEALMDDPALFTSRRVNAADVWAPAFRVDSGAFIDIQHVAMTAASEARTRGVAPSSAEAAAIVERFASEMASAAKHTDPAAMRAHLREKYDPSGARYWELVAIMRGDPPPIQRFDDWRWLGEALRHHVRPS